MKFNGSIDRESKHYRRVVAGKRSPTDEKTTAERRYRRFNSQVTRLFVTDPEAYEDETFQAPMMTAWDLW